MGGAWREQGWHSGDQKHSPPTDVAGVLPGLGIWVEFVVGSCPCSKGFSLGTPVFLPPKKPTFPNSNSIWKYAVEIL